MPLSSATRAHQADSLPSDPPALLTMSEDIVLADLAPAQDLIPTTNMPASTSLIPRSTANPPSLRESWTRVYSPGAPLTMSTTAGAYSYGAVQPTRRYIPHAPDGDDSSEDLDPEDIHSYLHPPPAPQQRGQQQQQRYAPLTTLAQFSAARPPSRPQFRSKAVCELNCKYCTSSVCRRGMKVRCFCLG
jgi:hypothetical protein